MTEAETKLAALKFASEMCVATRLATIEECEKAAENCDTLGPSYQDHELTPEGLHSRKKVRQIVKAIRSLKSVPLDKEGKS